MVPKCRPHRSNFSRIRRKRSGALTEGALIEEWLMKNDFQPVVGHRFNFRTTPMAHWNG
jgi:hypothetical protein